MVRNSSKVKTRGLQHFQPAQRVSSGFSESMENGFGERAREHLSGLHEKWEALDGRHTPPPHLRNFSRTPYAHISAT